MKFNFVKLLGRNGNAVDVDSNGKLAVQDLKLDSDIQINISNNDGLYPDGKYLFKSNFDTGFDGWVPNFSGTLNGGMWGTISLTTGMHGNRSLQLSTGKAKSTDPYGNAAAIKRGTTIKETGLYSFDGWVDLWSFGKNLTPEFFTLGVDYQRIDIEAALRRFFQVRYVNMLNGNVARRWQVQVDNGAGGKAWVDIPGAAMEMPWNENKITFVYFRLTVDLTTMRYKEFQIYNKKFNLASFDPYKDPYHAAFEGGLNSMVQIVNPANGDQGARLHLDSPRGYFHD